MFLGLNPTLFRHLFARRNQSDEDKRVTKASKTSNDDNAHLLLSKLRNSPDSGSKGQPGPLTHESGLRRIALARQRIPSDRETARGRPRSSWDCTEKTRTFVRPRVRTSQPSDESRGNFALVIGPRLPNLEMAGAARNDGVSGRLIKVLRRCQDGNFVRRMEAGVAGNQCST